jgi:hypothetical protein
VAGAVRQLAERLAQPLVAAPSEAGGFTLARLDRYGGLTACAAWVDLPARFYPVKLAVRLVWTPGSVERLPPTWACPLMAWEARLGAWIVAV